MFLFFSVLLITSLFTTRFLFMIGGESETYDLLKIYAQALKLVQMEYVEEVSVEQLRRAGEKGIVSSLDGVSFYVPPNELENFRSHQSFSRTDSGIRFLSSGQFFFIQNVIPGSPADRAGLSPDDVIQRVGERDARDFYFWELDETLNGKEGAQYSLTFVRDDVDEPREAAVELTPYTVDPWEEDKNGGIPIITIGTFDASLIAWLTDRMEEEKGDVIIDIRRNAGGEYQYALDAAAIFREIEEEVILEGKKYARQTMATEVEPVFEGKAVLLVDGTVSGPGELFAALVRKHDDIVLAGRSTAGIAGLQKFVPLGGAGLWLTVAVYSIENHTIHGRGVSPDEVIVARSWESRESHDSVIEKAKEILQKSKG